ncbi:phosphoglycerate mutase [Pseudopedobacter saltans DSM 12145]|uniref:2,3-bisphosphoglycerate-dependent phosphoglycerate mutase n=1 Tax=Pseudopedobacter saltans (strain ATCC 51119 / DSM 12145 / JCM 21818 / CCUG 39354 / LMG 10337 / NBRC 100064 / NCIMB 13643) TaxID=762903 RepID=F0S865_PSESL|nr:2,3-bisphosphoglycerate-dependent phosphoglycerate mutase [Pseudopedobacter saltans]ADY52327.1 phosphoglycerate mutase [Pseudopedobacter saltans DSM 12145]
MTILNAVDKKYSVLILLRHGQSLWNLENRFTGWQDIDITKKGEEEALHAGKLLKNEKIDIAFTSTLKRAQHTLEIILKECGIENIPVIIDKRLNERSYGDLEGLNKSDTALKYGSDQVMIWRRSYDVAPPGGESLKNTAQRVLPYFHKTIAPKLMEGKTVLIVAHGNSLRALMMFLENLSPEEIANTEIPTGIPRKYVMNRNLQVLDITMEN